MSRILIVEDEESIADLEKDYLELAGFEVQVENNGNDGLAAALSGEYDMIILDLMLPGVDGFEICRQVREQYDIPILMVTAKKDEIGLVNGLAWTAVGGTLLPLECVVMPGSGKIELTGSLGDVMQESAKAAITAIRTRCEQYHIDADFYQNNDIHLHALEGAIPKDGPSAGVTMATALYSALTGLPVRADVAMTGEIGISGKVLPIGGLKEKSMAAYKSGVKHVIIPKENERDLADFDPEIRENITYHPVETIDEVLALAIASEKKKSVEKAASPRKKTTKPASKRVEVTAKGSLS